jgi:putative phosphoribosyl transferase
MILFRDRAEAGRILAEKLRHYANNQSVVVLALPRGGVPVAYPVAQALRVPLDVFVVRKLGLPGHEELAMGAIASGGVLVLNEEIVSQIPNAERVVAEVAAMEAKELERREALYRGERPPVDVRQKVVILVDDGAATGATMKAAVVALRKREVAKIVTAVPVGAPETCDELRNLVDESICVIEPESFRAVGQFYRDFSPTTDEEVRELLARAQSELNRG